MFPPNMFEFLGIPLVVCLLCFPAASLAEHFGLRRWRSLILLAPAFVIFMGLYALQMWEILTGSAGNGSIGYMLVLMPLMLFLALFPMVVTVRRTGLSTWWFLLCLFPGGAVLALWGLAFADWPALSKRANEPLTPLRQN